MCELLIFPDGIYKKMVEAQQMAQRESTESDDEGATEEGAARVRQASVGTTTSEATNTLQEASSGALVNKHAQRAFRKRAASTGEPDDVRADAVRQMSADPDAMERGEITPVVKDDEADDAKKTADKDKDKEDECEYPKVPFSRVFKMQSKEYGILAVAIIGAIMNGCLMPGFAIIFTEMVSVFYELGTWGNSMVAWCGDTMG